jgi:branched-chain amino acid transport system permease protein
MTAITAQATTARNGAGVATLVAFGIMVAALVVAPFYVYPPFLMKALCFAMFALAFNLLIGYVGLLSFGHALFFGWAAYLSAHVAKLGTLHIPIPFVFPMDGAWWHWAWLTIPLPSGSPELALLVGTLTAALFGLVVGLLAIRRQGIYFAMVTLALAQMMFLVAVRAKFTGGEDGIQAVPRGRLFGLIDLNNNMTMYVFVAAIFLGVFLLIYRIINSPFGEVLKAIRENEGRAISLGYKTERYKLAAFVLSTTLAGLAGSTKALVLQIASLTDVNWPMSGEVVLMVLVGGLGTIFGPAVGAVIIIAMQNYLAQVGEWVTVIQGAIFVLCVLLFRRGIVGEIAHLLRIKL